MRGGDREISAIDEGSKEGGDREFSAIDSGGVGCSAYLFQIISQQIGVRLARLLDDLT